MSSDLELETSTGIITQALSKKSSSSKSKTPKKKPSSSSSKPKSTAVEVQAGYGGRNEGTDPDWAYAPPPGASLINHNVDAGLFEWDTIKDDDEIEIWLIRVPDSIKPKHLEGLEIDLPSSDSGSSRIGQLTRKTTTYDIWSLSPSHSRDDEDDNGNDTPDLSTPAPTSAEELFGLSCLFPRKKKKGKLYLAPKPITRHIVISSPPTLPTPPDQPPVYQDPPRPSYSQEWLTHSFEPYGARAKQGQAQTQGEGEGMDVDEGESAATKPVTAAGESSQEKHTHGKSKEGKSKKRKVEGDSPKKSKKHKTSD